MTSAEYDAFLRWRRQRNDLVRRQLAYGAQVGVEASKPYFPATMTVRRGMENTGLVPQSTVGAQVKLLEDLAGLEASLAKSGADKVTASAELQKVLLTKIMDLAEAQMGEHGKQSLAAAGAEFDQAKLLTDQAKASAITPAMLAASQKARAGLDADLESIVASRDANQAPTMFDPLFVETIMKHAPEDLPSFRVYRDSLLAESPELRRFFEDPRYAALVRGAHRYDPESLAELKAAGYKLPPALEAGGPRTEATALDAFSQMSDASEMAQSQAVAADLAKVQEAELAKERGREQLRVLGVKVPEAYWEASARLGGITAAGGGAESEEPSAAIGALTSAITQLQRPPTPTTLAQQKHLGMSDKAFISWAERNGLDPRADKAWRQWKQEGRGFKGLIEAGTAARLQGKTLDFDADPDMAEVAQITAQPAADGEAEAEAAPAQPVPIQPPPPSEGTATKLADAESAPATKTDDTQAVISAARDELAELSSPRSLVRRARRQRLLNFDEDPEVDEASKITGAP